MKRRKTNAQRFHPNLNTNFVQPSGVTVVGASGKYSILSS
ncbi:hypothetical protein R2APBS1_1663 [Rhodanobacter denitrificans]|uniref:Uncharacterized protein n=1 Tax=Rhodanobacter denitrificans TaxID=666685 RepID=M4NDF5_9GAMM|nr:hypothetical protein R2APBS1_1663 [Rhodanobacter denitrificans]